MQGVNPDTACSLPVTRISLYQKKKNLILTT